MKRREFILAAGAWTACPRIVRAQQTKLARIGLLIPSALGAPATLENFGAIRQAFADLGYIEGRDIAFEPRGGDGTTERLAAMAAELVASGVDVISNRHARGARCAACDQDDPDRGRLG